MFRLARPARFAASNAFVVLGPVPLVLTRPNDGVAYAAGDVYGPAGDARFQLVVPALPAEAATPGFGSLQWIAVHSRSPADPTLGPVHILLASEPLTTVLGDNVPLALNDVDIARLLTPGGTGPSVALGTFTTGAGGGGALNEGAGLAGRRGVGGTWNPPTGAFFMPGTTLGGYLWLSAAYAPLALESIRIRAAWNYTRLVAG